MRISALSSDGTGIAYTDRGVFFVQNALPGELVRAEILSRKRDFSIARAVSFESSSKGRTEPKCRYYGRCGGCQLQHADYETQLELKAGLVKDAMTRLGGFEAKLFDGLECEPSPQPWGYRNKAAFPVQGVKGRIVTGFYRAGSHNLELIKQCPVNAYKINSMYEKLLEGLDISSNRENNENIRLPLDGYDESSHSGKLRHVIMRTGINTGESLLSFVINGRLSAKSVKALMSLGNKSRPSTLTLNHNSRPGNTILGTYTESLIGDGNITELLGNFTLRFDTSSFFQINTLQAEKLFLHASDQVTDAKKILELYSGVGSLTCYLARDGAAVTSVEEWRGAVHMARHNLKTNNLDVNAMCGRAEEIIDELEAGYDAVVIDPPRDGCARAVLDAINNFGVKKIIYVSCNPATLARDCRILSGYGYVIESVRAFDMFPQTAHVETVVVLQKG